MCGCTRVWSVSLGMLVEMRIGNKMHWCKMGRIGRTGKPQSCEESTTTSPAVAFSNYSNNGDGNRAPVSRGESHVDFPW